MSWTPEKQSALLAGIAAGKSRGQIAEELGMTRNAVIGKADRLLNRRKPRKRRRGHPKTSG